MKNGFITFAACLLVACGGGGESASTPTTPVETPVVTVPTQPQPESTALKDNEVAMTTEFNQFATYLTQLPDKTAQFKGTQIFIKVYTHDGNALYLGKLHSNLALSLHLPNHIKSVKIDVFSSDPQDPQITEEITL
ncbi:hypothetical protein PALB_690 [Pseudoalteromonas luteoviolacea B = ATCC 29581]|nr:hypothetical protein PALB_690 [Pseudoalteromonas luteoviolacea B = ATCC 29581]